MYKNVKPCIKLFSLLILSTINLNFVNHSKNFLIVKYKSLHQPFKINLLLNYPE